MSKRTNKLGNIALGSVRLRMRRAHWAGKKAIPTHKGMVVDPVYLPRESRDLYEEKLQTWWNRLDPKAQNFLGPMYKRICTGITHD